MVKHTPVVFAVGYSARALIEACWQAGFECVAVDHFGDADTRNFATNDWIELQVSEEGLLSNNTRNAIQNAVAKFHQAGKKVVFLLSGGMENWGGAVEQLREIGTVIGPTEDQRRALRDIAFLGNVARATGINTPKVNFSEASDGSWLWKPHASAGGLKIVRSELAVTDIAAGYWQEFIPGEQIGVSCLIDPSRCQILGATSSFDSADWSGPLEFIYRGSIGPIALSIECQLQIARLCQQIRRRIGFCGWLQFDFIRDNHGRIWLLECNPRWTAGMEILLFVGGVNPVRELLSIHDADTATQQSVRGASYKYFAKAVVYATHAINLTTDLLAKLSQIERLADLPYGPQWIQCGHPIATVRASLSRDRASMNFEDNRATLLKVLQEQAEQVSGLLT